MPPVVASPALASSVHRTARWQLVILLALALVRGLIYLSVFPPWLAPDEPAHFEAARIYNLVGTRPTEAYYHTVLVDPAFAQSMKTFRLWEFSERATPTQPLDAIQTSLYDYMRNVYPGGLILAETHAMLPYIFLWPVSVIIQPLGSISELYLLRLVSVLLGLGVVAMAWDITRLMFPRQPLFWLAIPAFIVFLPMRTHIFAAVNTDVFAILIVSTMLWLVVSVFYRGLNWQRAAALLLLMVLTLFIKRTALFATAWVGVAALFYLGYRRRWPLWRVLLGVLMTLLLFTGLLALALSNAGKLTALNITLFNFGFVNEPLVNIALVTDGMDWEQTFQLMLRLALFAHITFWGVFGFNNINIPWDVNYGLMLLSGVVTFGAVIAVLQVVWRDRHKDSRQANLLSVFAIGVLLALFSAFFPGLFRGMAWGPQARYYFPAIIPIATFYFLGVWQLCPARYRQRVVLPLWLLALVGFDALTLTGLLIPYIYG